MGLREEIHEQPAVLQRLIEVGWVHIQEVARAVRQRDILYVFLAARGTSDNAGLYAKYLWGAQNRLPVALAAPSLFSVYHQPPYLSRSLVVCISQSGQSPDIVSVMQEGRRQGALTLAITNDSISPLALEAEWVLDVGAGEETAVAATKTYTAQLMTVALLSAALGESNSQLEALRVVPDLVQEVLAMDDLIQRAVERYRYMHQCVVLGRGYNYATAFEWSLKLKELAYVVAEPYSSADFRHGPIAVVEPGFPVFAVAPQGAVYSDVLALLRFLAHDHQAELLVISNGPEALSLAHAPICLPAELLEWISPLVSIVPAQLLTYHLARAKGWDTETPRGLRKVTRTS